MFLILPRKGKLLTLEAPRDLPFDVDEEFIKQNQKMNWLEYNKIIYFYKTTKKI